VAVAARVGSVNVPVTNARTALSVGCAVAMANGACTGEERLIKEGNDVRRGSGRNQVRMSESIRYLKLK
jgi:hypothetical protein